jgi:hypothetical protein
MAVLVVAGLLAQDAALARQAGPAAPKQVKLTWGELSPFVVNQKISTVLTDGTRLQGEAMAVRPESLVLDIQKSSRKKLHALGQAEIPKGSIRELKVIRVRGPMGRIAGTILGVVGGIAATGGAAVAADSLAMVWVGLLVIVPISAVAGYYAGKLADQRTTRIEIKP